ncbi:four helix bundle protein [Tunicatimonas pelagia]|uniref:four helix bundle protein n=1 Tax=Tunicatimonas pelagia TaxID=931531 RepID=UPI00266629B1|nr:four helix bundle protein [Tunicatimonas pelagia]WKN46112.1 four helix bundle protein [Tunicatimonas pelagia]
MSRVAGRYEKSQKRKIEKEEYEGGDLKQRTKDFASSIIKLSNSIAKNEAGRIIKRQLLRSATSVGANTRAAFRSRSRKEFVAKLGIVIEEADES